MTRHAKWCLILLGALMITGWTGCRSVTPRVNYYVMTAVAQPETHGHGGDIMHAPSVGLRTVEIPGYANRLQMVRQNGSNRLVIDDVHRWADYPDRMVQRVIGENMRVLMAERDVYNAPWPTGLKPERVVDISILEMIATDDQTMRLTAVWTIDSGRDPKAVRSQRTTRAIDLKGSDFADLAEAHDRVLALLSQAVADSLR
ncbi:MAG: hypothetical protein CR984_02935 [Proteobacteria bacterium]|nr:MAG: hypothetical protein CR984_02935 [Pseudomonadota bacterium]PIE68088.1 MAG: hypothetical protein CSA23_00845 [Deltaproteobacteria bacterium]